jgi:hypothetical protein
LIVLLRISHHASIGSSVLSIADLPSRRRSRITNALLLNQKPERRWTPFVVVSYGSTTYKTKVRSQSKDEPPIVLFNTPIPDIAILKSQTHWDVVFSLWDSQAIGTNKAIGTSLSVEVDELIDREQREGGKYWETSSLRPFAPHSATATNFEGAFIAGEAPEDDARRSFDVAESFASNNSPTISTDLPPRNVFRAKSWTINPPSSSSPRSASPPTTELLAPLPEYSSGRTAPPLPSRPSVELPMVVDAIIPAQGIERPFVELPIMTPSPTTDIGPSAASKRRNWLTSRRTRSRSHSPAKVSAKSGHSSGGSADESSDSKKKGKRRPLSPLAFARSSRSPALATTPVPIPGLRFPVMQTRTLTVERAPVVDAEGKVEELPGVTLNVKVGFSPRSRGFCLALVFGFLREVELTL